MSNPSFNQKKIHFLLTQRTYDKSKKNIIQELELIKKIGKKFYRSERISNKILKIFFGYKFLKLIANLLTKISNRLQSIE